MLAVIDLSNGERYEIPTIVLGHNTDIAQPYEKLSDQGPVWVRKDVNFQVQEKNIFIFQNHSQMVLLGVWREDFTKKSPDHLF